GGGGRWEDARSLPRRVGLIRTRHPSCFSVAAPRPSASEGVLRPMTTVFIDGESGTTGLGIRERLGAIPQITLKSLSSEHRRDPTARRDIMAEVDLIVL